MTLYGFFWSDCIYESGPVLVSIHRSKMGALRAMIAAQAARWEARRSSDGTGLHLDGLGTFKERDYRYNRAMEAFAVHVVEVLP